MRTKFRQLIHDETWEEALLDGLDAQSSYSKFNEIYTKHYNTAYPLRNEHVRSRYERKNPKPWILPWLEIACARKMIYIINSLTIQIIKLSMIKRTNLCKTCRYYS